MWSRISSERSGRAARAAPGARRAAWSALGMALSAVLWACSSAPTRPQPAAPVSTAPATAPPAQAGGAPASPGAGAPGAAASATVAAAPPVPAAPVHPEVSLAAQADFQRAVAVMEAGNADEAELAFQEMAQQYPQYAAPLVNLAILSRKQGHLDKAEDTLRSAVARESGSAVAWTELGLTQRMRGEFNDAAGSYQQAIAADARYAPAWRNLGVLSDLYLGDPNRALAAFEQYKQLSGEDKPVSGWIAELRQRLGLPPLKRPEPAPAPDAPGPAGPGGSPGGAPGETAPGAEPTGAPAPVPPSQPAPGDIPANATSSGGTPRAGG